MFTYILIFPSLLIIIATIFQILRIRQHDEILFMYFQLRRNMNATMREQGKTMSASDYELMDRLETYNDALIQEFNLFKRHFFNLRRLKEIVKKSLEDTSNSINKTDSVIRRYTDNKEIQRLQHQLKYTIIKSIVAFTPFLKSQLVLGLSLSVMKLLIRLSLSTSTQTIKYLIAYRNEYTWIKQREHQHNIYVKYA